MAKPGLLAMALSRGRSLSKICLRGLRGKDENVQRRQFKGALVADPKVVLMRAALGDDVDVELVRWAIGEIKQDEKRWRRYDAQARQSR